MGKSIVDLHSHIIPGADDGSGSLDMSLHMLRSVQAQGVSTVFATSHSFAYDYNPAAVRAGFDMLKETVAAQLPSLHLYLGCEVSFSAREMEYKLRMLENGTYPTMNGSRYVLTEFRTHTDGQEIEYCTGKLLDARLVAFLGTDAHRSDHRPPKIEAGLKYLRENYDPEYVTQITSEQGTLLRLL